MNPGLSRTFAILTAITAGALLPQARALVGAVPWLIVAMLFLVFLQTRLARSALERSHFVLLGANIALGIAAAGAGWLLGGREVGLAAFFAGITPTASAAPVIISFLRGRVDYVAAAFLLTNLVIAAALPAFLPLILGRPTPEAFAHVTRTVAVLIFLPFFLASLVRTIHRASADWPGRLRNLSFGMWVTTMFLITANASHFLRQHADVPLVPLLKIGGITALVCATNFAVGHLIGGREFRREASQALGQKNTAFTIYLAMTYGSPLIALGPTFYVVWHNLWNSWQLHRAARRETPRR